MRPVIPWQVTDAIILWARARGRTARVYWNDVVGCPTIELSCLPDDPKQVAWQEGRLRHPPIEPVFLHWYDATEKQYKPVEIEEYGAEGILAWLDAADMHSGRGEAGSFYDSVKSQIEANQQTREAFADQIEEAGRESAWLSYRTVKGLPLVSVAAEVLPDPGATTTKGADT
jgi:hypothetical protein